MTSEMSCRLTSRRALLGAGPVLAIAAIPLMADTAAGTTTLNDDHLLDLLRQIGALEAQWSASVDISSTLPNHSPEMARYEAREDEIKAQRNLLIDRVNEMQTRTIAGFQARARSILQQSYGDVEDGYRGQLTALLEHLVAIDLAPGGNS